MLSLYLMKLKKQIQQLFIALLVLVCAVNNGFASTGNPKHNCCITADELAVAQTASFIEFDTAYDNEQSPNIVSNQIVAGSLSVVQVLPGVPNPVSKRVQGYKDLLLFHSAKLNNSSRVKYFEQVMGADRLKHISLFLFPYHFFW